MCKAWGDPHYKTFDGDWIDYMGINTYTMAQRAEACTSLQHFLLKVDQEMRNDEPTLSYVNWIMLVIKWPGGTATVVKIEEYNTITVSLYPFVCTSCIYYFPLHVSFQIEHSLEFTDVLHMCGSSIIGIM